MSLRDTKKRHLFRGLKPTATLLDHYVVGKHYRTALRFVASFKRSEFCHLGHIPTMDFSRGLVEKCCVFSQAPRVLYRRSAYQVFDGNAPLIFL